ncbi:MAG: hypothetical protein ACFFD4_28310 [Candidatus Odinarchaeota archaeon]
MKTAARTAKPWIITSNSVIILKSMFHLLLPSNILTVLLFSRINSLEWPCLYFLALLPPSARLTRFLFLNWNLNSLLAIPLIARAFLWLDHLLILHALRVFAGKSR